MANSYYQHYVHTVFALKYRKSILNPSVRPKCLAIIAQQIKDAGCTSLIVNGVEDHVHCLFSFPPKLSISDILQKVKAKSSKDFNDENIFDSQFRWQSGSGSFTVSHKDIDSVYKYIENQEAHHKHESFLDEFLRLLKEHDVDYDPRYIFGDLE